MQINPSTILVIDFGQLGDVVLSLPALSAIRAKFPRAHITVAAGSSAAQLVDLAGVANETLAVDRVALRDGPKLFSIARIVRLTRDIRRRGFELVIDLHSLSETNILGYLSGAPARLFARRPGRSIDFLGSADLRPPVEDRKKHAVDRYLEVLAPFGIKDVSRVPRLKTKAEDDRLVENLLVKEKAASGVPLVGLYPGAGHESRRWPIERFAELAEMLKRNEGVQIILFAGPEERELLRAKRSLFNRSVIILDCLTIPQLAAALARLSAFVSNDTGPMHIAAAVGAPVVLLLDQRAPRSYIPIGNTHRVVSGSTIADLPVDEVYAATRALLVAGRTESLFAS